jgi:hypothetical protein
MPHARWTLEDGRPVIDVVLRDPAGQTAVRKVLADTGAGTLHSGFELVLHEGDCQRFGGQASQFVVLGGAYSGSFPVYWLRVQVPGLAFDRRVRAVGVAQTPPALEGIACFRFLSRFTYGNFGNSGEFGLEE